jgi:hypothetical protein
MKMLQYPVLQYRWAVRDDKGGKSLVYYGLRNPPRHTQSVIPLEEPIAEVLNGLDGSETMEMLPADVIDSEIFLQLVDEGIVVENAGRRQPATKDDKQSCTMCVADDHLLPGLEFDERGVCAFCQCYEKAEKSGRSAGPGNEVTEAELLEVARKNDNSRFDVMVLCTGGKDSTYLLWYLAKKLGLRVLAASWNMPYTNDTCKGNIRRALELLPNVELIERTLPWNDVQAAMKKQFGNVGVPCLCPTVAHVLFYPLAVEENIPFVMHGVEEVQLAVMNYVMSELKSGKDDAKSEPASIRQQTMGFLNMIANAPEPFQPFAMTSDFARYQRSIRKNLDPIYGPLDSILHKAKEDDSIVLPQLRRLKTNESYGSWSDAAELIKREMNWQMPLGQKGLLHTSCRIEKVKDYCQYMRFRNMRSTFFPQSIVEVSAGVYFGMISREEALIEVEELGYHHEPEIMTELLDDLRMSDEDRKTHGETYYSLCDCMGGN